MLVTKRESDTGLQDIDSAVQREFQALSDFLARLEDLPPDIQSEHTQIINNGNGNGASHSNGNGHKLNWWVILRGVERLRDVFVLRQRLSDMPGCIAARVMELSSQEIQISMMTTSKVSKQQIEFAVLACGEVIEADIVLRSKTPVG